MAEIQINPYKNFQGKIYAYTTPKIDYHDGYIKIGYTERNVDERIKEQTQTVGVFYKIEWIEFAPFDDATNKILKDTDFHRYLIDKYKIERSKNFSEWFKISPALALKYFKEFCAAYSKHKISIEHKNYNLREEQIDAVEKTVNYYLDDSTPREFLWNAKPRFGKTLSAYDFILQLGAKKILIVTNRPSISNSWYEDFQNYVSWQNYKFVSTTDSLPNNLNYEDFSALYKNSAFVAFISLQDLKGSKYFGGNFDKLKWIQNLQFDLLIVDESHEGADTAKAETAFKNIRRDFTLYLSGTPFKALANNYFRAEQIFNWSYADEQNAKINWSGENFNPYADLPQMNLFSYQLSKMVDAEISVGEDSNYLYDLNEFFSTKSGKFIHENAVKKFLDALTTREKFPFSTKKLRAELKHTFWILQRVDSVKALAKILREHKIFKDYKIIIAAGDGQIDDTDENLKSLAKVKKAVATCEKTITLSVGQLTTGVTVPEWTAVLMLSEMQSAAQYLQAAFRAQNPCTIKIDDKNISRKENCYVFDFSPVRTLKIYNEYAESLGKGGKRETVENLLKVFPVFAENDAGELVELDAKEIMSLPQKIAATQIVDSGFMSNDLFKNIYCVFNVPAAVKILNKIRSGDNKNKNEISIGETAAPKNKTTRQKISSDKKKAESIPTEEKIRAKLRDFARTIPSFIMAYGDENLTLANFETYIDDKTFEEVTGITKIEFIYLRDGGSIDGEIFEGKLFDEDIFNAAIQEFLQRKKIFGNYFDDSCDADIFDFIPPQKTSQIFTPRQIVTKMVDALEFENPNILDNPRQKFFDPYMKSGLYIAEIVKRLYRNKKICAAIPNNEKRLKHILENQVYGCAPSEIIFRIATNFIFGNRKNISQKNFSNTDILQKIQSAELQDFLKKFFSRVIILNKDRVKKFGEVFTPPQIVNLMLDSEELADVFQNIDAKILEPTAGDGIFLVGILERKLKLAKNSADAFTALSSIYGIEIQFDNLACAQKNLADTFTAFHEKNFGDFDKNLMWQIIYKNIVHGDALEFFGNVKNLFGESLFEDLNSAAKLENVIVIGNPPYQADIKGDNKTYAAPVYHLFLESFWQACNRVMMIHPARCLFNPKAVTKNFNEKILSDEHLKVILYEPNSSKIFDNVDIRGGVAVTYRDANKIFGKIGVYILFPELQSIFKKVVVDNPNFYPLSEIMYSRTAYSLTKKVYEDFPNAVENFSKGNQYQMSSNVFELIPEIFFDEKPNDGNEYIQLLGVIKNKRIFKFVRRDYVTYHKNLEKYKIFIPDSNGSGAIGEKLSTPLVGLPLVGNTQTFITLGAFDTRTEADNALKFVKTKFARALLGVLKVTQHNPPATWKYVPLQDFTANSDIDWSRSIAEIDLQLYKKYKLTAEEINFIEEKVRAM